MTYINANRDYAAPLGQRLSETIVETISSFTNWRLYRQTLAELQNLSAAEMHDLGINPSMVRRIAYESAYGKTA